ncbi:hypothetical protein ACIOJE_38375 [Kitasatospora sp. NPDC087861]|uniref:hypothetical protein n=1 Tax=Kitasatospora sp. NPDC087861 TaxID=3364070 RepID=UPI00381D1516
MTGQASTARTCSAVDLQPSSPPWFAPCMSARPGHGTGAREGLAMGEKDRKLKAAARQRKADMEALTGEPYSYQTALNEVKAEYERGVRPGDNDLFFVVDFPPRILAGADPCPACHGTGLSRDQYEDEVNGGLRLLIDSACTTCWGCGRTEHETRCIPGDHATDDPHDIEEYQEFRNRNAEEWGDELADPCPSCRGRRYWWSQSMDEEAAEEAHRQLMARAALAGHGPEQVQGALAFGELDDLLGRGDTELAMAGLQYLRMPCGCTEKEGKRVRRADLTHRPALEITGQVPAPRGGGYTYERRVNTWLYRFTGCPHLGDDVPDLQGQAGDDPGEVIMAERRRPQAGGMIDGFVLLDRRDGTATYRWVAAGSPEEVLPQILTAIGEAAAPGGPGESPSRYG